MSNVDVPHDKDSDGNEVESPVDGPTPDWMRMATSASNEPSLTEENTPDWLREIQSGSTTPSGAKKSAAADDEMSDLERLLAEEGIDLNSVEDDIPAEAAGMSARDWMIATSDDEVIRKRIGDTSFEMEQPTAKAPFEEEDEDDPFAGMSDLERLLAEEGVDLSSIEDDIPAEARGMSARDWMISTSDDEMIRKRIGATSFGEPEPPAAKSPAPPEEEPGDILPDWLQEMEDEPELDLAAEAVRFDDDLPDWLREEAGETEVVLADDDTMIVEEELPDWLQDVEDVAPGFEPVAASTIEDDDKMVVTEDLPDWLRDVEDEVKAEPLVTEADSVSDATEELPDWLRDVEEEATTRADEPLAVAESVAADDMMVIEEDLPDWLRDIEEEPEPSTEIEEAAARVESTADDMMVVEEDLPDWLQDVEEDLAIEELELVGDDGEEGLPDWLQEVQEEPGLPSPMAMAATSTISLAGDDNIIEEDELPDWLRDVEVEDQEPELEAEVADIFADDEDTEDLPDWLTEVQAQADEAFEPSEPAPLEPAELGEEDLPDWLQEAEIEEEEFDQLVAEAAIEDDGLIDEAGLPDWLQDVGAELEPEAEPEIEVEPEAEPVAPVVAPEPEPLAEAPPAPAATRTPEEAVKPAPAAAPTGMPDWLRKLREGSQPSQPATPVPAPVPVVAAATRAVVSPPSPPARPAPPPAPVEPGVQPVAVSAVIDHPLAIELPANPDELLKVAQSARDEGDLDRITVAYEALVSRGAHLDSVINDVEMVIRSFPSNYRLYQVKGDAMMRDGRLQGALDSYRKALERLPG